MIVIFIEKQIGCGHYSARFDFVLQIRQAKKELKR